MPQRFSFRLTFAPCIGPAAAGCGPVSAGSPDPDDLSTLLLLFGLLALGHIQKSAAQISEDHARVVRRPAAYSYERLRALT
jgi:MYXO-CTERM domain-containing protein